MRCTSGVNLEMLRDALSRSRAPIGGALALLPAECEAGHT